MSSPHLQSAINVFWVLINIAAVDEVDAPLDAPLDRQTARHGLKID